MDPDDAVSGATGGARRPLAAVAIGLLVVVVLAAAAASTPVTWVEGPPDFAVDPDTAPPPDAEPTPIIDTGIDDTSRVQIPPWIGAVFEAILLTAAVAALVYLAVLAWRRRPRLRWRRRRVRGDLEVVPDLAAAVAADADEQRAALRRGTPRNAIVECWLRLERAVEEAGFVRRPSDTSTELTERVLADSLVDRRALRRLAALYREARFSDHRLGEDRRDAAIAALDEVHAGLAVRRPADVGDRVRP